jgi:hypothetical protein
LIWSPEKYLERSTDHEAPHLAVSSSPLLPILTYAQISFSAPYSQTPSAYVHPWIWELKFHTRNIRQSYCNIFFDGRLEDKRFWTEW